MWGVYNVILRWQLGQWWFFVKVHLIIILVGGGFLKWHFSGLVWTTNRQPIRLLLLVDDEKKSNSVSYRVKANNQDQKIL